MAFQDPFGAAQARAQSSATLVDAGLRSYMLNIYNYMASGLALTGIIAFLIARSPELLQVFFTVSETGKGGISGLGILMLVALFALPLVMGMGMNRFSATTLQACFWGYASLMGIVMSTFLLIYTGESVARAFFITASVFGAMSIYGYTTKRDLTGMGSFMMMGMFGAFAAMLVNLMLQSSALSWAISAIVLICSIGLTAYENQSLKNMYYQVAGYPEMMKKVSIMGALHLYISFINIFITVMRMVGERR